MSGRGFEYLRWAILKGQRGRENQKSSDLEYTSVHAHGYHVDDEHVLLVCVPSPYNFRWWGAVGENREGDGRQDS